jgi:spermidine/putrescine transport system substrate-binding protein
VTKPSFANRKLLGAIAVVAATLGMLGAAPAQADKIVISNWDSYMPADLLDNFTKETGIETEFSVHATNEEIMGKITASGGKGLDIVFVSSPFAEALENLGLSAKLDHGKIPNIKNLYAEAADLGYDVGNTHSVPYTWGTTGLCYRSDLVSGSPSSWYDLLKPGAALKGKITMLATDRWLLGAGLKALGYSINTQDQGEITKARDLLIEAKKNLLAYDDTTFYSKLVSAEAHLVHAWDGWCNYGIAENPAIKFVVPTEGSDLWADVMVIMNASENKDAAHQFMDYVLRVDTGKWVAENILYKVPNKAVMDSLDPGLIESFPNMAISPAELLKLEPMRDIGKAQKAYTRAVTEITASQ